AAAAGRGRSRPPARARPCRKVLVARAAGRPAEATTARGPGRRGGERTGRTGTATALPGRPPAPALRDRGTAAALPDAGGGTGPATVGTASCHPRALRRRRTPARRPARPGHLLCRPGGAPGPGRGRRGAARGP